MTPSANNPWGISFMAMIHMSNDSGPFRTTAQLIADGAQHDGSNWLGRGPCRSVRVQPLPPIILPQQAGTSPRPVRRSPREEVTT